MTEDEEAKYRLLDWLFCKKHNKPIIRTTIKNKLSDDMLHDIYTIERYCEECEQPKLNDEVE